MKDILRLDTLENNDLLIIVYLIYGLLTFASLLFFVVGKIKPNANLKALKDRTKSWWVMAIVFMGYLVIQILGGAIIWFMKTNDDLKCHRIIDQAMEYDQLLSEYDVKVCR